MRSRATDLRFVEHPVFGLGCVFADERQADTGSVLDIWFADDQKLRAILSEHVSDTAKPELPVEVRKALRAARSEYRQTHKRRVRQTADKPRVQRAFRDRIFKAEWRHIDRGDDPAVVDVDQDLAAD